MVNLVRVLTNVNTAAQTRLSRAWACSGYARALPEAKKSRRWQRATLRRGMRISRDLGAALNARSHRRVNSRFRKTKRPSRISRKPPCGRRDRRGGGSHLRGGRPAITERRFRPRKHLRNFSGARHTDYRGGTKAGSL